MGRRGCQVVYSDESDFVDESVNSGSEVEESDEASRVNPTKEEEEEEDEEEEKEDEEEEVDKASSGNSTPSLFVSEKVSEKSVNEQISSGSKKKVSGSNKGKKKSLSGVKDARSPNYVDKGKKPALDSDSEEGSEQTPTRQSTYSVKEQTELMELAVNLRKQIPTHILEGRPDLADILNNMHLDGGQGTYYQRTPDASPATSSRMVSTPVSLFLSSPASSLKTTGASPGSAFASPGSSSRSPANYQKLRHTEYLCISWNASRKEGRDERIYLKDEKEQLILPHIEIAGRSLLGEYNIDNPKKPWQLTAVTTRVYVSYELNTIQSTQGYGDCGLDEPKNFSSPTAFAQELYARLTKKNKQISGPQMLKCVYKNKKYSINDFLALSNVPQ
jgi:hypothetical protein